MTDKSSVRDPRELRVLLFARYDTHGASSRVRHYSFIEPLRERNIKIEAQHLIDNASIANFYGGRSRRWHRIAGAYLKRMTLMARAKQYDAIWIEKELLPGLPFRFEQALFNSGVATILDFDDYWIARHQTRDLDSRGHRRELNKLRATLNAATVVTAANDDLADALAQDTGRRPVVFNNAIDTASYVAAARHVAARTNGGPPRIGWIGTPYTAAVYLPPLAGILNRLSDEGLSRTLLIGAGGAVPEIRAERIPWSLDNEARDAANIDIGIQPLGNSRFDHGKSGWKIYQYMAAGRLVVATRGGYISELVDDGATGFLVSSEAEFEQRLRALAGDTNLRASMGQQAQMRIVEKHDIGRAVEQLADLIVGAVDDARHNRDARS